MEGTRSSNVVHTMKSSYNPDGVLAIPTTQTLCFLFYSAAIDPLSRLRTPIHGERTRASESLR